MDAVGVALLERIQASLRRHVHVHEVSRVRLEAGEVAAEELGAFLKPGALSLDPVEAHPVEGAVYDVAVLECEVRRLPRGEGAVAERALIEGDARETREPEHHLGEVDELEGQAREIVLAQVETSEIEIGTLTHFRLAVSPGLAILCADDAVDAPVGGA